MMKGTFKALLKVLWASGVRDSRYIMADEQLAIFLYASVTGASNQKLQVRFQRSADTISK